ncbi:uncharacterized protein ARMOST_10174 [Armillaria ostoyae]|uniref:Uncharacterized protein n=1 Tax=Armillaria ostoyae TaxID=47428 RepID=A0A284RDJ1_ARMOS|nr:uncharacterized protein ARMOST_10174 [Armillaria ostoyae]
MTTRSGFFPSLTLFVARLAWLICSSAMQPSEMVTVIMQRAGILIVEECKNLEDVSALRATCRPFFKPCTKKMLMMVAIGTAREVPGLRDGLHQVVTFFKQHRCLCAFPQVVVYSGSDTIPDLNDLFNYSPKFILSESGTKCRRDIPTGAAA